MCSNTIFRGTVHLVGSNLNLERTTARSNQCRVERLVHVLFRHCDIIFETSRNWLVFLMNNSECRITIPYRIDLDTNCMNIVNLVERLVLRDHFLIDGEQMLDTSVYLCLDASFLHILLNLFYHLYDEILARIQSCSDLFL